MLYLFVAFIAGVVTLATAQLITAQLRRSRAHRARLAESRLITRLRAQGWTEPSVPPVDDWLDLRHWTVR